MRALLVLAIDESRSYDDSLLSVALTGRNPKEPMDGRNYPSSHKMAVMNDDPA